MISLESIKYSLRNLVARKSRSFLTILSIFVGITTIFIFISFGWGLYAYINDFTTSSSADKLILQGKGGSAPGLDQTFKLDDTDLNAVEKTIGILDASAIYFKAAEVTQGTVRKYTFLIGYDPKKPMIMEFYDIGMAKGRMLEDGDRGKVVLGYNYLIPNKIFPRAYNLNDKIEIQGKKLKIIGFLDSVGSPPDDAQVYVVSDYISELYPDEENSYAWIMGRADINNLDTVVQRVEKNVRKSRGQEEGKEDFYVQSFSDMLETYSSALNIVIGFIVLIAFISVLVSAVNTANTMITSVLERIKEIGVIKAVGARNSDIFGIFLFESSFLGFIAGIFGVLVGFLFSYAAGALLNSLGWGFLTPKFSASLFIGCILFATVTGAISGVAPAINAAKRRPVDALRYE